MRDTPACVDTATPVEIPPIPDEKEIKRQRIATRIAELQEELARL
jgi:hypothetical protein